MESVGGQFADIYTLAMRDNVEGKDVSGKLKPADFGK